MPNAAKATKRYEQRMKDKGFVRKHVWVPAWKAKEIEKLAENLRRDAEEWTEEEFLAVRKKAISDLKSYLEAMAWFNKIRHVTIFGSFAKGDATPASDVDLYVELEPDAERGLSMLSDFIYLFGYIVGRKVDVVVDPIKNALLREEIEQDGIMVF